MRKQDHSLEPAPPRALRLPIDCTLTQAMAKFDKEICEVSMQNSTGGFWLTFKPPRQPA